MQFVKWLQTLNFIYTLCNTYSIIFNHIELTFLLGHQDVCVLFLRLRVSDYDYVLVQNMQIGYQ